MRHCFRFFPAAVLLSLLVTACAPASSPDAPSLQATELGHGTSRTSVETQIQSGSLSSDNGAWLTLQVKNLGGTAILVTLDKDPETCITIEPGASGTLTTELSAVPSDHLFQLRAAQAGAELYAAHTLVHEKTRGIRSPGFCGFSHSASGSSLTAVVAVSSAADEAALVAHLLLAAGLLLLALALFKLVAGLIFLFLAHLASPFSLRVPS